MSIIRPTVDYKLSFNSLNVWLLFSVGRKCIRRTKVNTQLLNSLFSHKMTILKVDIWSNATGCYARKVHVLANHVWEFGRKSTHQIPTNDHINVITLRK
jgi:hypothetical protein